MPSFQDSAFIILLGLLLFGPKGLAKIARQLGKLVGEFRRASADFRFQMEDELRADEQAEQQKKIAAMEAAAPVAPLPGVPLLDIPEPEHPHTPVVAADLPENHIHAAPDETATTSAPLPIASSGHLDLMPPPTGLPVARTASSLSLSGVFDSIPHAADPSIDHVPEHEAAANG